MSSMRNAITRRPHKERSQPQSREKWGILEKHKDYSLRAQDYNQKKKKLSILQEKAREKNPDEFAFGMLSAASAKQGKHRVADPEKRLSHDAVSLLKTQDAGYLRTAAAMGRREIRRLEEETGLANGVDGSKGKKIVFGTTPDSQSGGKKRSASGNFEMAKPDHEMKDVDGGLENETAEDANGFEIEPVSVISKKAPSKRLLARASHTAALMQAARKKRKHLQEVRAAKLELLKKRQREILAAADVLELQRAQMAKTVGGVNKNGVKFRVRERKR